LQEYFRIAKIFNAEWREICPLKPGSNLCHQAMGGRQMLSLYCTDIRGADERMARQRARSPQKGSAFGVSLLEYAVRDLWGIPLPPLTPPGRGKPGFVGTESMHFSLSHTNTHVLAALSDAPVGADVQLRRPITQESARVLMDDTEWEQFEFHDLWCLRESLYKLNGAGHLRDVLRFRRAGDEILFPVPNVTGFLIPGIPDCAAAVCQERPFVLPELRWVPVEALYA